MMTRKTNKKKWNVLKNRDDFLFGIQQLSNWGIKPYVKLNKAMEYDEDVKKWLTSKQIQTAAHILLGYFTLTESASYARDEDPVTVTKFKNILLNNPDRAHINKYYGDNKLRMVWETKSKEGKIEHTEPFIFNEEDFLIGVGEKSYGFINAGPEDEYTSPFDFLCKIGFFTIQGIFPTRSAWADGTTDKKLWAPLKFYFSGSWDYSNKICHHLFETDYFKRSKEHNHYYLPLVNSKYNPVLRNTA